MEPNLDMNRLKAKLESIKGLRLLILYGSLAEGYPRRSSDVDILVDCDEGSVNELEELLCQEFRGREPHIVKVGWLRPEALLHTARRGIVLVDRDVLRRLVAQVSPEYLELRGGSNKIFKTWLDEDPIDIAGTKNSSSVSRKFFTSQALATACSRVCPPIISVP